MHDVVVPQGPQRRPVPPPANSIVHHPLEHIYASHAPRRGELGSGQKALPEAALAAEESGDARGLGLAAWWLDLAEVVRHPRTRTIYLNRTIDCCGAWLCGSHGISAFRGEHAIATAGCMGAPPADDQPPALERGLALRRRLRCFTGPNSGLAADHQHRRRSVVRLSRTRNSWNAEITAGPL
jgi:hypothetical protein